jgi:hypothetical protein
VARLAPSVRPARAEADLVDGETVVLCHVARQVDGEAEGVPQVEGFLAGNPCATFAAHAFHQLVEDAQPVDQRAVEALLLVGDRLQDIVALGAGRCSGRPFRR